MEKFTIGDFCITNQNSYTKNDKWDYVNYLDTGNITRNSIDSIQQINLLYEKLPNRAKRKVRHNSIVYSTVRPNQRHYGIIKEPLENFLVSTGFTVIDINDKVADADYLYYFLSQNEIVDHLQTIAEQSVSTYPSIKASDIEKLEIELPEIGVQRKVARILSAFDKKIRNNIAINDNLTYAMSQAKQRRYQPSGACSRKAEYRRCFIGRSPIAHGRMAVSVAWRLRPE